MWQERFKDSVFTCVTLKHWSRTGEMAELWALETSKLLVYKLFLL